MKKTIIIILVALFVLGILIPKLTVHDLVSVDARMKQCATLAVNHQYENPFERIAIFLGKSRVTKIIGINSVDVESFTLFRIPMEALLWEPKVTMNVTCDFASSPENIAVPTSASTDKIVKWETYRNEEYGFEVKYPNYFHFMQATSTKDTYGIEDSNFADVLTITIFPGSLEKVDYTTVIPAVGTDGPFRYLRKDNKWHYVGDPRYHSGENLYFLPTMHTLKSGLAAWVGNWSAMNSTQGGVAGETVLIEHPARTFVIKLKTERCDGVGCGLQEPKQGTIFKNINPDVAVFQHWPQGQSTADDIYTILSTFKFTR